MRLWRNGLILPGRFYHLKPSSGAEHQMRMPAGSGDPRRAQDGVRRPAPSARPKSNCVRILLNDAMGPIRVGGMPQQDTREKSMTAKTCAALALGIVVWHIKCPYRPMPTRSGQRRLRRTLPPLVIHGELHHDSTQCDTSDPGRKKTVEISDR